MSESIEGLRKKINSASDLGSVVRTMKALAASSLGQYERSVNALDDYYRTVELGICACLHHEKIPQQNAWQNRANNAPVDVVVFGSDQGLVGRFNEAITEYTLEFLNELKNPYRLFVAGERVENIFTELNTKVSGTFSIPSSVNSVTPLIGNILNQTRSKSLYVIYNRPDSALIFEPVWQQVLPIDLACHHAIIRKKWPTKSLPDILGDAEKTFHACVREYIFVSIFRACTLSLAAENASRLASMQRAEKNINEILDELELVYHRLRQGNIDEELFDVIAGFEALMGLKELTEKNTGRDKPKQRHR